MIAAGATSPAAIIPDALAHFPWIADKCGRAHTGCLQNSAHQGGKIFMSDSELFADRMLSLGLTRLSEAVAVAAAQLIGRGDEKSADAAAVGAMRTLLDIAGTGVIGEGERDEAPMLYIGEQVGTGNGPGVDIALDPLEGTALTAKDMPNALTVIAMGPRGSMLHLPDVFMETGAVDPGYAPGRVHLALLAADLLAAEGTSARVPNFSTINPPDDEAALDAAETAAIVTVEAASVRGGPGGAGAEFLATHHPVPMEIMGFPGFLPTGSATCLFGHFGVTAHGIAGSGRRASARKAQ